MPEPLHQQLWRLSEAGEPAFLLGRCHEPQEAALFEHLLSCGVLHYAERLTTWDVCTTCDCGAEERQIRQVADKLIAVCPLDHTRDDTLDSDDLLVFRIDIAAIVREAAAGVGTIGSAEEVSPGVWWLGQMPDGRMLVLTPTRRAILQPGLVGILRMTDPTRALVLLGPVLPPSQRALLKRQGIQHEVLAEMGGTRESSFVFIDLTRLPSSAAKPPRLTIHRAARLVRFDEQEVSLPPRPFQLLCFLAERLKAGEPLVSPSEIQNAIFSQETSDAAARRLVAELRKKLGEKLGNADTGSELIENRGSVGYGIALPRQAVQIDP